MIKAAASGDPTSYALAEIFTSDEVRPSLEPDLELAAEHYSSASLAPAMGRQALIYSYQGSWLETTNLESRKTCPVESLSCRKRPGRTCTSANHYLGRFYYQGIGVNADPKMALVQLPGAADRGASILPIDGCRLPPTGRLAPSKSTLPSVTPVWPWIKWKPSPAEKISAYEGLLAGGSTAQSDQLAPPPPVPSPVGSVSPPPPPSPTRIQLPAHASLSPTLPSPYEASVRTLEPPVAVYPPPPSVPPVPPSLPPSANPAPLAGGEETAKSIILGGSGS